MQNAGEGSSQVRFGFYFIIIGVVLFVVGLIVWDSHVYTPSFERFLSGVFYPMYLVGVVLVVVSMVVFLIGFYRIVKERVRHWEDDVD